MHKVVKTISDILFITALILAAFLLVSRFANFQLVKVFVVSSGSMEPAIKTGSIVVVSPASEYKVGDIITFYTDAKKRATTTHRIVAIGKNVIRTAGDANNQPDYTLIDITQIMGRVRLSVPYLGYIAGFTQTPWGFILLVIVPATIIVYEELKSLVSEIKTLLNKRRKNGNAGGITNPRAIMPPEPQAKERVSTDLCLPSFTGKGIKSAVIIPIVFAGLILFSFSGSFFKDTEVSSANSFTAGSWEPTSIPSPSPTPIPGPGDVVINEINWAGNNDSRYDEWIELKNTTNRDINLTSWTILNLGDSTSPNYTISSGVISAQSYFLISHYAKNSSRINSDPNILFPSISLDNNGEQLTLKSDTNTIIDIANGAGVWFYGSNTSPKKSMERKGPPGDGTISANWQNATTHTNMDNSGSTDEFGTPKAPNGL